MYDLIFCSFSRNDRFLLSSSILLVLAVSSVRGNFTEVVAEYHLEGNSIAQGILGEVSPERLYQKVFSYTKNSKAYEKFSYEEMRRRLINITTWDPPDYLKKAFPYYLAGYDYENRPVWVAEIGKFDFRGVVEKGEASTAEGKRYIFQAIVNGIKSIAAMDSEDREIKQAFLILDADSASFRQLNYIPTWLEFGEFAAKYWDFAFQLMGHLVAINVNQVAKLAVDILRPIAGQLLERVEIYGTNRKFWLPKLLKHMPIESIPPWYGGKKEFKPIFVNESWSQNTNAPKCLLNNKWDYWKTKRNIFDPRKLAQHLPGLRNPRLARIDEIKFTGLILPV